MEIIDNWMGSMWFDTFTSYSLWVSEFVFFVILIQLTTVIFTKIVLATHDVDEMSPSLFGNITLSSLFWASFIKFYVV